MAADEETNPSAVPFSGGGQSSLGALFVVVIGARHAAATLSWRLANQCSKSARLTRLRLPTLMTKLRKPYRLVLDQI